MYYMYLIQHVTKYIAPTFGMSDLVFKTLHHVRFYAAEQS